LSHVIRFRNSDYLIGEGNEKGKSNEKECPRTLLHGKNTRGSLYILLRGGKGRGFLNGGRVLGLWGEGRAARRSEALVATGPEEKTFPIACGGGGGH